MRAACTKTSTIPVLPTTSPYISRPTAPKKPQDPGLRGDKTPVSPGYSAHTLPPPNPMITVAPRACASPPPETCRGTGAVWTVEFLRPGEQGQALSILSSYKKAHASHREPTQPPAPIWGPVPKTLVENQKPTHAHTPWSASLPGQC